MSSLEELHNQATVVLDHNTPLKIYFRSADLLFRQAAQYYKENDWKTAYVLYMKYVTLAISELPKHHEYNELSDFKNQIQLTKTNAVKALDLLEILKPKLESQRKAKEAKEQLKQRPIPRKPSPIRQQPIKQSHLPTSSHTSNSGRDLDSDWWKINQGSAGRSQSPSIDLEPPPVRNLDSDWNVIQQFQQQHQFQHTQSNYPSLNSVPPSIPPKIEKPSTQSTRPKIPQKALARNYSIILPNAKTESGTRLRTVHIPRNTIFEFEKVAKPNTNRNIETCGILAGYLSSSSFHVTHLVIPEQRGTSDTCTTENEEQLFNYLDTNDLIVMGWIHTHPSQTCFLSSCDLHTHASYQLMLPEAVAIVIAPKQSPEYRIGVFRLTDPPGLRYISNCPVSGSTFHPHDGDIEIYRNCDSVTDSQGHVSFMDGRMLKDVVDLRRSYRI